MILIVRDDGFIVAYARLAVRNEELGVMTNACQTLSARR
jgi:hypothetical protein